MIMRWSERSFMLTGEAADHDDLDYTVASLGAGPQEGFAFALNGSRRPLSQGSDDCRCQRQLHLEEISGYPVLDM
jgi:hypothetical protein